MRKRIEDFDVTGTLSAVVVALLGFLLVMLLVLTLPTTPAF